MAANMREKSCPGIYDGKLLSGGRDRIRLNIDLTDHVLTAHIRNYQTPYGSLPWQRFIQLTTDQIRAICPRPSAFPLSLGIEVVWTDPFGIDHQLIFGTWKSKAWLAAFEQSGLNVVANPSPMRPWRPTPGPTLLADVDIERVKGSLPVVPLLPPIELHESHYKLLRLVVVVLVLALIVLAAS